MGQYAEGSVWFYAPNNVAPIVFMILFLFSGCLHTWQTIKYKSWRTTGLLPWAAVLMITGFLTRELGAYDYEKLEYVIASTVLILSGPPVYALINYFILSRILYYMPYLSPMHPGRVVTTFAGLDVIVEIMLAQGAWRSVHSGISESERQAGEDLVRASLLLQVVLFLVFMCLVAYVHFKAARASLLSGRIRTVIYVLYVSSAIVTIRCIYRIVEYFQGWEGTLFQNEPYFWVFEASIMFINTVLLNVWFPGKRLPRSNSCFLARDGVTQMRGPGWSDDRPWLINMFDPLDIYGLVTGRKHLAFWHMTQEELDVLRAQKKANKRPWYALVFDPLHLWGPRGYIGKRFSKGQAYRGTSDREAPTSSIPRTLKEFERTDV
ncbi:hypothetical protein EJ05DRAFT_478577 [Pseudovirgaria hyperparasitica]|uniref:RTA1 domain protein n=1 Tax=Pseudovirgaria hyperparasitica TaxID=470096 RepID=A0A6A6VY99_9PEZI|nr:uncharacterized protein EJ05DRAFT_478577 [Pseudovirgaria hyperparasitica]KAF2755602.1 hypothetical protein EJ05DRAFT_478577 [Pseudovirgaria hyperparasitica]